MATIGPYTEVEYIANGTFGKVFVVYRTGDHSQTRYALKKINLVKCNAKDRQHAHDEATTLQRCSHEHLVAYIDNFDVKNHMCIVMEFCQCGSLRDYIRRKGGLDEPKCQTYLKQVCLGLKYLHDLNIAHRDIKTTNIFLTRDKRIKIGDFGLARVMNSPTFITLGVGTPYFMSPEMIKGQPYDKQTDIWSLGCCVYEMATGTTAFKADTLVQLQKDIVSGQVDLCILGKSYCEEFTSIFRLMMKQDSQARPSIDTVLGFVKSHNHSLQDKGYVSADPPGDPKTIIVHMKVKVSDAEKKWFSKCTELERDLQDQIGDDDKTGQMLEALDKSKNMDNSDIFMEQMRQLLGGQYHMCRPDLLALWGYKTELLKKKYRMA